MKVYLGWDDREVEAWEVAAYSISRHTTQPYVIQPISRPQLERQGIYTRSTSIRGNMLHDDVSDAPMATDFSLARFWVPFLESSGWALFADCDILLTRDLSELFALADDRYAVMCVKHNHDPVDALKMDEQIQTRYARKNWSSVMLINCAHPAHNRLSLDVLNEWPGRDLHAFRWLADDDIGALPGEWNWLEGHDSPTAKPPALIHYTRGGPWMEGWDDVDYADLWRAERAKLHGNLQLHRAKVGA